MDKTVTEQNFKQRFRDITPETVNNEEKVFARYISHARAVPLGMAAITVGTTPTVLPFLPAECRRVIIYSVDEDLTYTDKSGDTPSASFGMIIPSGTVYIYDSDPDSNFQMWAAADTDVRIAYYG